MNDEAAVRRMLAGYYAAFGTLDLSAILPFFHEPAVLIGALGVFPAPGRQTLAGMLAAGIEHMRAAGYARSELDLSQLTLLSEADALALGVATRYRIDGSILERVGVTYVLHKSDAGWKIAVLVMHDAAAAPQ